MLNDEAKQVIQSVYSNLLDSRDWKSRHSQRVMIAEIAKSIANVEYDEEGERTSDANCCVVEAGTGTGKTLAYTIAAIPLAQQLNKTLIISTATVALQEQILYKDLPDIQKHSGLNFTFALAKGRRRYVCLSRLDKQLNTGASSELLELYPDEVTQQMQRKVQSSLCENMLDQLSSGAWNGDRECWDDPIEDEDWFPLTVDRNQCTGRHCAFISQCSFFKARDNLEQVDCIVANHDLVLSDLALGGGAILSPPQHSIYIFDEAHHLSQKALQHFSYHTRLSTSLQWLEQMQTLPRLIQQSMKIPVQEKTILLILSETGMSINELSTLLQPLAEQADFDSFSDEHVYRFSDGVVPKEVKSIAGVLGQQYQRLINALEILQKTLDDADQEDKQAWEESWNVIAQAIAKAQQQQSLWNAYARSDKNVVWARWLVMNQAQDLLELSLHASPILAQDIFQSHLWDQAFATVLSSATLSTMGHFNRIQQQLGIPENSQFINLQSPFDFKRVVLHIPNLPCEPNQVEEHTNYLINQLPVLMQKRKGTLVLFSSRRQMQEVYENLDESVQACVMTQDDYAKIEVIRRHREMIDKGQSSTIFGLASFSEGVDLPGVYCQHVIIAKIPFAVPGHPIDEALADWLKQQGKNPFMEVSVPDAIQALLQSCGRLLRHEDDEGDITLLDKRVLTKRYGQLILDSLPPYQLDIAN